MDERRELLMVARRRTFARNEVVFHRDDPADTMHLIVRGRFAVRIVTPLGDTATLALLSPGQTFGEVALLTEEGRRTATVLALEPGETRSLHQVDFAALQRRHPQALDVLVRALATRLDALSAQLVDALYVPADRRVLRRVAELAALYGEGRDGEVAIPLTQEDIAGLAGTSRATVNRVLRECEARGLVRLERGRTVVLNAAAIVRGGGGR
ncbi:MAG TPA: Crp/Fnr family transcriptional regulator [Baekduia sp.]|uniref:Crp/Fnr family transcriptional regulator n=1 Tax=Baekduia sp. TaxID=2600305 RepID=UPI002C3BEAB4|nr:Crp/Fnr family transcriptional regulator [Baekduia sp.]HMJ33793.1 Crp/Fnr family transcriptional regulator [Baekduia sp.]